jgi:hypothetical protein
MRTTCGSHRPHGPRAEEGKQQSRRNALRHGLTAETVIGGVENVEDYTGFEAAIIADYDAQTAVERELILRVASLLWRSRRAIAIETALFEIQAGMLRGRKANAASRRTENVFPWPDSNVHVGRFVDQAGEHAASSPPPDQDAQPDPPGEHPSSTFRGMAHCFLRLANLDSRAFERLNRYEVALWRQTIQTLFALQMIRRRL